MSDAPGSPRRRLLRTCSASSCPGPGRTSVACATTLGPAASLDVLTGYGGSVLGMNFGFST